jgi:heme exporter protein D
MNWNSASEFFAMGGYALYVWGSFGVCAFALAMENILVEQRRKAIVTSLRRRVAADRLEHEESQ